MPSRCSSVDLPAPEGPMMDMNSPSFTSALTRRNTKVLVGPCSKYFSTLRRTIIGELILVLSTDPRPEAVVALVMQDGAQAREDLARQRAALDADGLFDANRIQRVSPVPGLHPGHPEHHQADGQYGGKIDIPSKHYFTSACCSSTILPSNNRMERSA